MDITSFTQPSKIVYFEKVQMGCNFLGNKINGPHARYIICSPSQLMDVIQKKDQIDCKFYHAKKDYKF